jgi:hypothetical protein
MTREQADERAAMLRMERKVRPLSPDEYDFMADYELGLIRFDKT